MFCSTSAQRGRGRVRLDIKYGLYRRVLLCERGVSKILYPYYKIFNYLCSGKHYLYLLADISSREFYSHKREIALPFILFYQSRNFSKYSCHPQALAHTSTKLLNFLTAQGENKLVKIESGVLQNWLVLDRNLGWGKKKHVWSRMLSFA